MYMFADGRVACSVEGEGAKTGVVVALPGGPATTQTPGRGRHDPMFWTSYIRLALVIATTVAVGVLVHLLLTPHGPHRLALEVAASTIAAAATGTVPFAGRVARQRWRIRFSLAAALLGGVVLSVGCYLDSGIDSPIVVFLGLPVATAALGLEFRAVMICAMAVGAELAVVALTDPHVTSSVDAVTILITFLAVLFALSLGWARNRSRSEREEAALTRDVAPLATVDPLTGCLNHAAFFEGLDQEIELAMRTGQPLSLLVADVDLFKAFNDAHGHAAGNHTLAAVGRAMRRTTRSLDIVGRVGEDEFAAILPGVSFLDAHAVAEQMSEALDQPDGHDVRVSIGVAALTRSEPTARRLFRDADAGLYVAKATGRARAASTTVLPLTRPADHRPSRTRGERDRADTKHLQESVRRATTATAEAVAMLDAFDSSTSVGLGFIDSQLRIVRLNPVLTAINGGSVEDQLGRHVAEVVPNLWPVLAPALRSVLDHGQPLLNQEVAGDVAADPGHRHFWLTNLYPIRVHGYVTGICVVANDITERKEWEQSQATITSAVVGALAAAVEMRDPYTAGHQERVAEIAVAMATDLGLDTADVDAVDLAARIHDVGKLAIPAEILARPGRLSEAEMALVREHAQAGSDMLERVGLGDNVREMIVQHHERLDGSGYPNHLGAERISTGARIIAVADVVEAVTSHRPYRPALGIASALEVLRDGAGTLFDPEVVESCTRLFHLGQLVPHELDSATTRGPRGPLAVAVADERPR
jgi:diguanylate cyclase (GGDEF)-like protein/putative nucleotidyltransferase with HDIG domain/PAS domain S-box-containing protein